MVLTFLHQPKDFPMTNAQESQQGRFHYSLRVLEGSPGPCPISYIPTWIQSVSMNGRGTTIPWIPGQLKSIGPPSGWPQFSAFFLKTVKPLPLCPAHLSQDVPRGYSHSLALGLWKTWLTNLAKKGDLGILLGNTWEMGLFQRHCSGQGQVHHLDVSRPWRTCGTSTKPAPEISQDCCQSWCCFSHV